MSKPGIIGKLDNFLRKHTPPDEECFAIYLLVEIRKVIEHDKITNRSFLKFYADWSVHTSKNRLTPQMKQILDEIYAEIDTRAVKHLPIEKDPKLKAFLSMKHLRDEMQGFLHDNQLPDALVSVNGNWTHFHARLVSILAEQPIVTRGPIKRFYYEIDHNFGHAYAVIDCNVQSKNLILKFGL